LSAALFQDVQYAKGNLGVAFFTRKAIDGYSCGIRELSVSFQCADDHRRTGASVWHTCHLTGGQGRGRDIGLI